MDYIKEARRTRSDDYHGESVSFHNFHDCLTSAIKSLRELDQIKKALFYGKKIEHDRINGDCSLLPAWVADSDERAIDIMHGIIGKATEAGELLEALYKCTIEGEPLDESNTIEEVGDGLWYDALILGALGASFEDAQRINISKLRKRYPDKFTAERAEHRDIEAERQEMADAANYSDDAADLAIDRKQDLPFINGQSFYD